MNLDAGAVAVQPGQDEAAVHQRPAGVHPALLLGGKAAVAAVKGGKFRHPVGFALVQPPEAEVNQRGGGPDVRDNDADQRLASVRRDRLPGGVVGGAGGVGQAVVVPPH